MLHFGSRSLLDRHLFLFQLRLCWTVSNRTAERAVGTNSNSRTNGQAFVQAVRPPISSQVGLLQLGTFNGLSQVLPGATFLWRPLFTNLVNLFPPFHALDLRVLGPALPLLRDSLNGFLTALLPRDAITGAFFRGVRRSRRGKLARHLLRLNPLFRAARRVERLDGKPTGGRRHARPPLRSPATFASVDAGFALRSVVFRPSALSGFRRPCPIDAVFLAFPMLLLPYDDECLVVVTARGSLRETGYISSGIPSPLGDLFVSEAGEAYDADFRTCCCLLPRIFRLSLFEQSGH
uniref:Secreted protein n=1 Tax=Ixodes ricinus TaxID=34613 RepID=A0A6B0V7U5_IXORI